MTPAEPDETGMWITASEAAQRLGVKPATLYAYVSRGLLLSRRRPGYRGSLYDRGQVDRLAAGADRARPSRSLVHRFRSISTAVSHSTQDALHYRGVEVGELDGVEDGCGLVLGRRPGEGSVPELDAPLRTVLGQLPRDRRIPLAVAHLSACGWGRHADPDAVAGDVAGLLPVLVEALAAGPGGRPAEPATGMAAAVGRAIVGSPATAEQARAVDLLLLQLLDHGLTASTTAARVAASARAGIGDCLVAGYAALAGDAHGGAPAMAHRLLVRVIAGEDPASVVGDQGDTAQRDPGPAVVGEATRVRSVPGFGHFLYPYGDPRADPVLHALGRVPSAAPALQALSRLRSLLPPDGRGEPNCDAALAVTSLALGGDEDTGPALFTLARTVGLAAHVREEYAEDVLRWRGHASRRVDPE